MIYFHYMYICETLYGNRIKNSHYYWNCKSITIQSIIYVLKFVICMYKLRRNEIIFSRDKTFCPDDRCHRCIFNVTQTAANRANWQTVRDVQPCEAITDFAWTARKLFVRRRRAAKGFSASSQWRSLPPFRRIRENNLITPCLNCL